MNLLPRRLVDTLIMDEHAPRSRDIHRYELFVAVNVALIVIVLSTQVYAIGFSGQPPSELWWTLAFTVPLQASLLGALALFFLSNRFQLAVNLSLTVIFLTVAAVVAFLGGPLGSVSVAMLFIPPVFAFVLLGLKPGLIWAVLTYATIFAGSVSELAGVEFPNINNTADAAIGEFIHVTVAYLSMIVMIVFYERSNLAYRKKLVEVAQQDDLTALPNRTAFYARLKAMLDSAKTTRTPFTLIYIDLDNFKPINDDYGHAIGDRVLKVFAERLRKSVRQQDFVCRLAGDEFAILLSETIDSRIAGLVMDRLGRQMQQPINFRNGQSVSIAASTGMAYYPHDATSLEALLHVADERMYDNKRETRHLSTSGHATAPMSN